MWCFALRLYGISCFVRDVRAIACIRGVMPGVYILCTLLVSSRWSSVAQKIGDYHTGEPVFVCDLQWHCIVYSTLQTPVSRWERLGVARCSVALHPTRAGRRRTTGPCLCNIRGAHVQGVRSQALFRIPLVCGMQSCIKRRLRTRSTRRQPDFGAKTSTAQSHCISSIFCQAWN